MLKVNTSPTSAVIEILSPDAVPLEEVLVKVYALAPLFTTSHA